MLESEFEDQLNNFLSLAANNGRLDECFYDLGDEGRPLGQIERQSYMQIVWSIDEQSFDIGNALKPGCIPVGWPYVGVSSIDIDDYLDSKKMKSSDEAEEENPYYLREILKNNGSDLLKRIRDNPAKAIEEAGMEDSVQRLLMALAPKSDGEN